MEERPIELIGVYHADGGIVGELRYVIGKARGNAHCALCDITHGSVRRKREWDHACRAFDIPIRLVHLNERSAHEAAGCTLGTPTVLARWADGTVTALLGPEDLELEGSVSDFFVRLRQALTSSS
jgi:hypothetical protein